MNTNTAQVNGKVEFKSKPACRHLRARGLEGSGKPCMVCTSVDIKAMKAIAEPTPLVTNDNPLGYLADATGGGRMPLRGFRFRIGRDDSNHIEIRDESVSRCHAIVTFEDGKYFIDDLGSRNGTLVNGKVVIRRTQLNDGDRIRIGNTKFCFGQRDEQLAFAESMYQQFVAA